MSKPKILIVEDESLIALDIEARLEKYGYEVCGKAPSGEQAILLVENKRPDLVLMDIMIKGNINGIQTAEEINKRTDSPIIYLTAYVDQATLEKAKLTNPFGYLSKPIQERDLHNTIEMALNKSRIEKELKVTKNWLQITLASIGDAVIVTDANGKINFMNAVAEKMTGWKFDFAVDLDLTDVFKIENEYTGEDVENPVNIVLRTGEIVYLSNHTNLISKDGEKKSILDSAAPIKDEKGNIQGVVLVFHDNTERKKVQLQLERESNLRKLIIESAAEGIFTVSGIEHFPNIRINVWNDRMAAITGFTMEEINRLGIENLKHYDKYEDSLTKLIEEILKRGVIHQAEFTFHDKYGTEKILSISASVIKRDEGDDLVVFLITDLTEKKKIELKLKENEENFRTLAENTPVGVFIHRGAEIIYANKIISEQTGFSLDEILKMKFWEFIHPEYREKLKDFASARLNESHVPKTHEAKFIKKSGEVAWAEITATKTIFNDLPAIIGIALDITERKKIEEKILLFAHAIKNIFDCVTITDLDNNLLYVNESFEKTYGYTSQEVLGKHISIVTAYHENTVESIRLSTLDKGWKGELINRKKDGTLFPISLKTSTIYDDNNNPVGLVGVTTDITERKHAEEIIKQSEKDYRGLFESAQDAILIFEPEGEIVLDVNQTACEMYGIDKEDFIGLSLERLSKNISQGKKHVANTLKEGIRYQFETTQYRSDGTEIELEISASVIEYKNHQAILSINRDITDRKLNETALRQSEARYRTLFETMTQGVIYQTSDGKIISANPAAEQLLGLTSSQLRKLSSKDSVWRAIKEDGTNFPGEEHPAMQALKTGNPVKGKMMGVYNPKIKGYKWLLVDSIPEFMPGAVQPHQVFTTFSDITPLRHAEKIQQSFFRISEASSSAATLEGLFQTIHSIVRELISAENFYIALYDDKDDTVSFAYFVDEKDLHPSPRKLGHGLTDYVIRENKSLLLSKEKFEELKSKKGISLVGSMSSHWLGVPLRIDDEVIGAVVVQEYTEDGKPYSEDEEKILSTISNQIALSIQRKRYSDALAESEKNYRTIFNTAPVGIFQSDAEGQIITVNNSFVNILGYNNSDEMLNLKMEELYFNKKERKLLIKHLLKNKSIVDKELEWKKKNGEKIWIELSAYVMKTHDETSEHFEGFIKDVTQRKNDEELILQLSSGIEQSPTSVIITDLDGNIEYVNPRFLEQTGYTFEEIKGQNPRILKSGETDKSVYDDLWKVISAGKQWRGELLNKKKNGELFWELAFIFPLFNSSGKIKQYLGIKIDITDRKILENELKKYQEHLAELIEQRTEELRLSEQKFKALAENSDDLIMRFNSKHEVLYMNPAVYKITNAEKEKLLGQPLDIFGFKNEIIKVWKKTLDKVFVNKVKSRTEFMIKDDLWIDWVLIPEFDQVGQLISVFSFGRDITAMKYVENELFRKDRLLQGVASASNILFTLEDFDVRIKNALEAIGKAADVDRAYIFESKGEDELISCRLIYDWNISQNPKSKVTSLYNDSIIFKKMLNQLQSGIPVVGVASDFQKEIEKILKSESIKCIINVPIEVFGKFWGFIGFNDCKNERMWSESEIAILSTLASDIGGAIARKIVESQLRSSEERLKILFDYAPEAYFLMDHNGVFIDGNKEAEISFGYTMEELTGKNHIQTKLFSEGNLSIIENILSKSREYIPTGPEELEIIRKDGSIANIELNTYPVTIEGKQLVLGAAHDISLRKKAEGEIRNALKHSQDLNQMKSRFVSMVSHEFRTPLSTILSSLELLEYYEDKLTRDDKNSHYSKITKSVDYLTELLDDVITINRADSGKLEAKYGEHEIVELINQLVSDLRGSYIDVPNIIFKTEFKTLHVKIDEKLFRQIISNLVSNAIKYTPADKNVHINLFKKDNHFIFEVRDEGVGIPEESRSELFTPFYRASNIGSVPGTGLGLAITKRSVDLLKGQITFNSIENEGTTFTVKLPTHGV